ncbi:MAG TPA: hypothetical protein DCS43_14685 [Verrucomicrobia bacterium]|nr:hypothetical protein [Verrucomicrobiota bacterium]
MRNKIFRRVIIFTVLMAVVLMAVQLLLNVRLNPEIKKALPALQDDTGLAIDIGQASVNVFSGSGRVEGLKVGKIDPRMLSPTLTMGPASLSIAWIPLLRKITRIEDFNIPRAELTLVRTPASRVRIPAATPVPPSPATDPRTNAPATPDTAPEEPADTLSIRRPVLPKLAIRQARAALRIIYEDQAQDPVLRLLQDVTVEAHDIYTYGDLAPDDWGTIQLTGHAADKPDVWKLDLVARVAPVSDPAVASFSLDGTLKNLNLAALGTLTEEIGIRSESADITVSIKVLDGIFQSDTRVILTLRNAQLTGKLKQKNKHISLPSSVTIEIPVGGTLEKPSVNVLQAITHSVLKTFAANPDQVLDQITIDGKSLRSRIDKLKGR